jgi:hypothetical protein
VARWSGVVREVSIDIRRLTMPCSGAVMLEVRRHRAGTELGEGGLGVDPFGVIPEDEQRLPGVSGPTPKAWRIEAAISVVSWSRTDTSLTVSFHRRLTLPGASIGTGSHLVEWSKRRPSKMATFAAMTDRSASGNGRATPKLSSSI